MDSYTFSHPTSHLTEGIKVSVRTAYIPQESSPNAARYVFAYEVDIFNESDYEVQLLSREWRIIDAMGKLRMVRGEGVVGKQPFIKPGDNHTYVSGCYFKTPIGQMSGFYQMVRQIDLASLSITIPSFIMVAPFLNN